ncbi:hypothetical protein BAUCODRAFT_212138 [Baudoinia panamericana UAMH 10762]|uniref:Methyltransferase type 11 domain-containing protein n=1 Tax=Baudoinia panamericana (strain UAMH 10762) TaxID=717646 RepID=M2MQR9_BAUPA|nr:uncharacterized protein BAUCODRAFT_212138 [Baudoinia panamericana UAMH 10762]EMC93833.1 hypothetical protein BAUCODRAFT_212138 [Baudoinia panamericana UAMH 10762]
MATGTTADGWDKNAEYYEATIGVNLTEPLARDLVSWASSVNPLETKGSKAFDNGCGTGLVARTLAKLYPDLPIVAADVSSGMIRQARKVVEKEGMKNVTLQVEDATNLQGLADESFTHTFCLAMIGSAPDPQKVASEMYRVTRSGGVLGIGSWVGHCWPEAVQRAVRRALDKPDYTAPRMVDPSTGSAEALRKLLQDAGWEVLDVKEQKAYFNWPNKQAAMDFFFDKEHVNPIAELMSKELDDEQMRKFRPEFEKAFDEVWPDATKMYETAPLAVARKK